MKFSLLSITAVLASFVAANPILAPRAASPPFRLVPVGGPLNHIEAQLVPEVGLPGYLRIGLFQTNKFEPHLFFPDGAGRPGPVREVQRGYELVFQVVPPRNPSAPPVYQALAVDRAHTKLPGIQPTGMFIDLGGILRYSTATAQVAGNWFMCQSNPTDLVLMYVSFADARCLAVFPIQLRVQYLTG